jgi:type IV pilus assembly protein PilB
MIEDSCGSELVNRGLDSIHPRSGALTPQELELGLKQANARNVSLWDILVVERQVPEDALAEGLSNWLNLPRVRLDSVQIEAAAVKTVSDTLAKKHTCLPVRFMGKRLVLAMANPLDHQAIEDVQFASSRQVQPVVASRTEILFGIEEHYSSGNPAAEVTKAVGGDDVSLHADGPDVLNLDRTDPMRSPEIESSPTVALCSEIIRGAVTLQASDIHVEPGPCEVRVRLRVDGVLRDHLQLPGWMGPALLSRIKILAKLDIAQQRLPQDGRIKVKTNDRAMDVRVSTMPTHFGEKAVLRLLGSASAPTLGALGLSTDEITLLDDALNQPQGLILVTGPTGAGKSTTLYSMLTRRQSTEVNVVTIEDPIEYQLSGANQVQVDEKAGVTLASCLRAILRQDPDIIMVGEIRDLETAEIAFQAALTGHLVLSTLHTNGSVAAIERLLDLGVKPMMITAATNVVIAQRLARRICMNCREPYVPSASVLRRLRIEADSQTFHHGRGCVVCAQTGYSGRVGIFEILRLTTRLKELVSRRATESELRSAAIGAGTRFLLSDALDKVRQGLTTAEEILRVIRIEHPGDDLPSNGFTPSSGEPLPPDARLPNGFGTSLSDLFQGVRAHPSHRKSLR